MKVKDISEILGQLEQLYVIDVVIQDTNGGTVSRGKVLMAIH